MRGLGPSIKCGAPSEDSAMRHLSAIALVFILGVALPEGGFSGEVQPPKNLTVAAVQFHPRATVDENATAIIEWLTKAREKNVRVVVFQECATTGYVKEAIAAANSEVLLEAERRIAQACDAHDLFAVVGTPYVSEGIRYNTAVVFGPEGELVERYAKIQLVGGDDWACPGETMSVFKVDDVPSSIIICHDERYPELVRLPVLAGSRLVFYVSSESGLKAERKIVPYRAQICARADENDVFIVHANSPAMLSHGQSRIIGPDGNILVEASMFQEEMITATLDMSRATGETAEKSLRASALRDWWREGMGKVIVRE